MATATLHFGDIDDSGTATRSVELPLGFPSGLEGADVTSALLAAGVTAADIRSRTVLHTKNIGATDLAVLVSALYGFTGRWVHVNLDGEMIDLPSVAAHAPALGPRPAEPPQEVIIVSGTSLTDVAPFARRALLAESMGPAELLMLLAIVATMRRRGRSERFPLVLTEDGHEVPLEDARRAGSRLRTETRRAPESPLAQRMEPSPRITRMNKAAEVPVQDVLVRLGSKSDESGERWHCPRPDRHTNGDQSPSMAITEDNTTQCFRCDPERVDAVRLVADTLGLTGDEAADWILTK